MMAEGKTPAPERRTQEMLQFLTTEHFTLQTERASANAEINGRLQLYMGVLSSSIIALALAAQVSELAGAFRGFAGVLLPSVYAFGLMTLGRMSQSWLEWFRASQGMNRIRHFYVEVAPDSEPYFVRPTLDDPSSTLGGYGIGRRPALFEAAFTAHAAVVVINSIVAGVVAGLLGDAIEDGPGALVPAVAGAAAFVLSVVALGAFAQRGFHQRLAAADVRFPAAAPSVARREPGPAG
jgi:hypothetical protein